MNKMINKDLLKAILYIVGGVLLMTLGTEVWAAQQTDTGVAKVAGSVKSNIGAIASLITAIAYVAGMAFGVAAIVKFKAHKDNPTQVPVGLPIVLLFVGGALLFIPNIFKSAATTLYSSGTQASVSGVSSF